MSSFFADLRDIKTETKAEVDKSELIQLFESHINGLADSAQALQQAIHRTTHSQYKKGI